MTRPHISIVYTGEVGAARPDGILVSSPLGSCIAICAYSIPSRIGGLAHVMLPGYPSPLATEGKNRYAGHALKALLAILTISASTSLAAPTC